MRNRKKKNKIMVLSVTPKNHNQKQTEKVGINSLGFALMSRTIWQIAEKQRKTNSKDSYRNRNSWHNQNEQLSVWNWKNNDRNNKISKNWQEKSKWKKKKDWKRKHQKWTKSLKKFKYLTQNQSLQWRTQLPQEPVITVLLHWEMGEALFILLVPVPQKVLVLLDSIILATHASCKFLPI